MTKLNRKLRDEIVLLLESYASLASGSVRDLTRECAWKTRQLDIEKEPLTFIEVDNAANQAGWGNRGIRPHGYWHEFVRADRRFLAHFSLGMLVETRYAPGDLLDGQLLQFDRTSTDHDFDVKQ